MLYKRKNLSSTFLIGLSDTKHMSINDENKPRTDRRIVRTRQMLRDALIELIVERGYDAINIQDITDRANVARTTFYLHFTDKDELLFSSMREIYQDLFHSILEGKNDSNMFPMETAVDYLHVQKHADFYRIMVGEHGSPVFITRLRHFLAEAMRDYVIQPLLNAGAEAKIPVDVLANLLAGAHIGIIAWWLEQDMPYSPEEMARMHEHTLLNGMGWAMGIDVAAISTDITNDNKPG